MISFLQIYLQNQHNIRDAVLQPLHCCFL